MKLVEATDLTTWKTLKTEVIDFQSNFYWINSDRSLLITNKPAYFLERLMNMRGFLVNLINEKLDTATDDYRERLNIISIAGSEVSLDYKPPFLKGMMPRETLLVPPIVSNSACQLYTSSSLCHNSKKEDFYREVPEYGVSSCIIFGGRPLEA